MGDHQSVTLPVLSGLDAWKLCESYAYFHAYSNWKLYENFAAAPLKTTILIQEKKNYNFFQNGARLSSWTSTLSPDGNVFRPGTAINSQYLLTWNLSLTL